jgi:pSer/pThr/pTyr-binding forkhead associated (FHA) protein
MWKLVIEDDEGKRTVVPLTRDRYSIGRKEGNTIRLTERNVSRQHARIVRSPGAGLAFVLEDVSSYNGVFVNGLRIGDPQELANGDLVQIGDYRIVLEDEALSVEMGSVAADAKQTLPNLGQARASTLLDRPNRLVMLAGPTPGAEFPLDRERMTIGRAEDAHVSVNHNSVSRLHCEVHALGDGRFEIVDKGSSNGVRVNGSDLRRGIIEPGDVIELGDVKFKFIGAGQIFRPTENTPLAILEDRSAEEIAARRRSANALPIGIFLVVVAVGAVAAWVWTRPAPGRGSARDGTVAPTEVLPSTDEQALEAAKKLFAASDFEGGHSKLASVADGSLLREAADYKSIENAWADKLMAQADAEPDVSKKRGILQRVSQAMTVDAERRRAAADKILALDSAANASVATPSQLPVAPDRPHPDDVIATSRPEGTRARWNSTSETQSPPSTSNPGPSPGTNTSDDRERQLALQGTDDSRRLLRSQLEQRVFSGKASDTEVELLISTCKDMGDKLCVQHARAIKSQRQQ